MRLHQLALVISKCPEEYTGAKQLEVPEGGGSVGRSPGCAISLIDNNRFISGTHCLISVYGDSYYLSDVSTNGTMVNGNKLLKNQPVSIVDGDSISLGQYEISVSLERVTTAQDIAADIAPERVSNDPLVNLDEPAVEETEKAGAIEDLFMETKQDDVDSHDPLAHLNFAMQRDDDRLIRDEEKPDAEQPTSIESRRQIADDSFSIHSEVDLPNLIPDDWSAKSSVVNTTAPSAETPFIPDDFKPQGADKTAPPVETKTQKAKAQVKSPEAAKPTQNQQSSHKWEEETQTFIPSEPAPAQPKQQSEPSKVSLLSREVLTPSQGGDVNDLSQAFYEGLGITNPELMSHETQMFKQMGTCLRLCIENLQKDLHEVESLKEDQGQREVDANIAELMLTLNKQNLLSPNELIEQMLDELKSHQMIFNQALNGLLVEQSETYDPVTFANDVASKSLFTTKSKLWGEYVAFYTKNRRQLYESSLKGLIKKNYNKAIKESHA